VREELERIGWRTQDGAPIAMEPPYGATVVVTRPDGAVLLLHRARRGPLAGGDWAWGPPAGARQPEESIEACARRELLEETGLELELRESGGDEDWRVFTAAAADGVPVRLSLEHDAAEWLQPGEAAARCRPRSVGDQVLAALGR
jgi:8-oxo-dGTP pyrophosphatase MutT (NUDIX family)